MKVRQKKESEQITGYSALYKRHSSVNGLKVRLIAVNEKLKSDDVTVC